MTSAISQTDLPQTDLPQTDLPQTGLPETDLPEAAAAAPDTEEAPAEEAPAEKEAAEESETARPRPADAEGSEPELADFDNLRLVEALLFASGEPLAPAQLARFLPDDCQLEPLLADLEALYANRGVNLVKRGGRWAFRTAEDLAPRMEMENKVVRKLSRVALETLSVIAYHQPVTRAEIEEIRGVALSKGTLDALLEIGWIRPKGRRKTPGRPVTWGTSDSFLDHFGLESLDALPGVEELKAAGLLDARPALTALSDRGMLPAAGEVLPERMDDEDDDESGDESGSELTEASERELLEETFGENLLPHEVELAAAGGLDETTAEDPAAPAEGDDGEAADEAPDKAPDEAETEMFGGADDAAAEFEDDDDAGAADEDADNGADDDLEDDEAAAEDAEGDEADDADADDALHHRQRSAGRA